MHPSPEAAPAAGTAANDCRTDPGAGPDAGVPKPDTMEASGAAPQPLRPDKQERFKSYHKPIRVESRCASAESTSQLDESRPSSSADGAPETGIIAIGMALGSPTYTPETAPPAWRPQFTTTVSAGAPPAQSQMINDGEVSPKSKPRKWGIFGRSWSKRVKGTSPAAGQDGQPASPPTSSLLARSTSSARSRVSPRDKEPVSSPPPRSISRSNTEPMFNQGPKAKAPTSAPRQQAGAANGPAPRQQAGAANTPAKAGHAGGGAPAGNSPSTLGSDLSEPLLDVEIPDVTLERYSVMFSHLLQQGSTSSLLARRQATQDRIKALKEGVSNVQLAHTDSGQQPLYNALEARAPQPTSVRVPPRSRGSDSQPSPRTRSNTPPATMPSPSRPSFPAAKAPLGRKTTIHIAESTARDTRADDATAPGRAADRPPLISKFHRKSSSASSHHLGLSRMSVEKPPSISGDEHFQVRALEKSRASSRAWSTAQPPFVSATPRSFASGSEERSLPPSPILSSIGDPMVETPARAPRDPVEVSIARQISVSRQQRALLGPLQIHSLDSRRISETKSSTPRIVDPTRDCDSPKAMHRKSSRVIVEGA